MYGKKNIYIDILPFGAQ